MREKILQDDLKVEKLSESHRQLLENFKTDNIEFKKFLLEDALKNQGLNISNTYIWFYKPNNEFVAYLTILADAIGIHGTGLGEYFQTKGVFYKTLYKKNGFEILREREKGTIPMYFDLVKQLRIMEKGILKD